MTTIPTAETREAAIQEHFRLREAVLKTVMQFSIGPDRGGLSAATFPPAFDQAMDDYYDFIVTECRAATETRVREEAESGRREAEIERDRLREALERIWSMAMNAVPTDGISSIEDAARFALDQCADLATYRQRVGGQET